MHEAMLSSRVRGRAVGPTSLSGADCARNSGRVVWSCVHCWHLLVVALNVRRMSCVARVSCFRSLRFCLVPALRSVWTELEHSLFLCFPCLRVVITWDFSLFELSFDINSILQLATSRLPFPVGWCCFHLSSLWVVPSLFFLWCVSIALWAVFFHSISLNFFMLISFKEEENSTTHKERG